VAGGSRNRIGRRRGVREEIANRDPRLADIAQTVVRTSVEAARQQVADGNGRLWDVEIDRVLEDGGERVGEGLAGE
jgi:hypothetical protein